MKTLLRICLFLSIIMIAGCQSLQRDTRTGWMTLDEMNAKLNALEQKEDGKNFWDRGHWITAVDGRWHKGAPEYRLRYSEVPEHRAYWWYWWFNQDQKSFRKHMHELADKGFTLVHYQEFERPTGEIRYQGVWHKLIK